MQKSLLLFPNLIVTILGILVSLQVVFQRFHFSPLILGDGGKKIYENVLLLTDFDSKYRHKIKSLNIGKSYLNL